MPNRLIHTRTDCRRKLLLTTLTALIAGVALTVTACDDDGVASLTVGPGGGSDRQASIANNHGHVATLTAAQLSAGAAVSLDIRGTADHSHIVGLGGAEVVQIRQGQRVTTTSSTDNSAAFGTHSHTVTFN